MPLREYRDKLRPKWAISAIPLRSLRLDLRLTTYGLAADIRMPDFGLESHVGWTEGVFIRNLDIDEKGASFIGSSRRSMKGTS